ncbi:glycosyltransferase WbsX family protein [Acetobacterium woodii]|uniref:Glycosyl transferase n=1 Tax=Acetobacterium woodii (strain ATCC 29683 / DSM 1030 / JCM 2381 / KCTC 1655 / WB1) TaxID=931626 RepID=H6LBC1_ACEWD|nr:glycoside hydrolase family 99-like domain-containing protein [Acetobacterium woodii]AFA48876.1 hypothetical protein Awo_c21000 [Acetobacterium woodii DSM 1030]
MSKIIAFYLPQFHSIPENDEWWGKGFTEWTNTKKAMPLYKNHYQPKLPYGNNYYNLLNKETRLWQAKLAMEHGVYGFCYYHYWFNGKMLLNKPLEEVLKLNEPELPFCMCWANEPWTRTWDGGENEILMPQYYGNRDDWQKHFEYLLPFFKDSRYITVDEMPLFLIYKTSLIENCDEMIKYWNELGVKNGLKGIYVAEELTGFQLKPCCKETRAVVEFEPTYTIRENADIFSRLILKIKYLLRKKIVSGKLIRFYDYDYIWNKIIKRKRKVIDKKVFLGAFIDWDNSARKKYEAIIFKGASPQKFEKYIKKQLMVAKELNSEFVFLNAWNEWAEGTYLEPDQKYGYAYLEAIKEAQNKL